MRIIIAVAFLIAIVLATIFFAAIAKSLINRRKRR